ncbi:hypothetical protein AAGV27_21335 [Bacillus velezensis]
MKLNINIKENKSLEQKHKELQKQNNNLVNDFYEFKEYITKYFIENGKEKEFLTHILNSFENSEVRAEDITHYTEIMDWLDDEIKLKEPKNRGFIGRLKEHIKEEGFNKIIVEPTVDAIGREFVQVGIVNDESPAEYPPTTLALFINEGEAFNYAAELFQSLYIERLAYCPMDDMGREYEIYTQKDIAELRSMRVILNR